MSRWVLSILFLVLISTLAVGQTVIYGPPGISTTLPMAPPAAPPVVTPPLATIPITPGVNDLGIKPPVTTIPIVQAVPPPIEPDPTTRMENALRRAYSTSTATASAGEMPFYLGVTGGAAKVEDGTHGRSLGEIAREKRRCAPNVGGRTFTNDDFERTTTGLIETVCP